MGNRMVKMGATSSGTVTTNSTFDLANRLTSAGGSSYVNDANGNTLSGGGRTMAWDSQNRMVSCAYDGNTLAFDYGADGLRRSETLTSGGQSVTTYYVYDGQSLVMEETKNAQGVLTPSATYLNGPRGPEYKKDEGTGLVKWYVYDGLGSVVAEVDPSGTVTYSAKYDVYGAVRAASGTANTAQGFVGGLGHLSEAATGLIYMRARYYDPNTGRFVSEDVSKVGPNWYSYCGDNPINRVDSTGRAPTVVGGGGDGGDFLESMGIFAVLLAGWNFCLKYSDSFRGEAASYLVWVDAFVEDNPGDPRWSLAQKMLHNSYWASIDSGTAQTDAGGGILTRVIDAYGGHAQCIELTMWFLSDDLGEPFSLNNFRRYSGPVSKYAEIVLCLWRTTFPPND